MSERLSGQDATLWCVQAPDRPLQIGALCLFEAGPLVDDMGRLRLDELRGHVERRLGDPRFRARLASVTLDQGLAWVEDDTFDITHHVRAATLPDPGGDAELRAFVSRLIEMPLDPSRPLWEIWVVDGLAGDRVAVVPKISHVMADGMAVLEFALSMLDVEPRLAGPDDSAAGAPEPTLVAPAPDRPPSLAAELVERVRLGAEAGRSLAGCVLHPTRSLRQALELGRAGAAGVSLAPALPITRPVGPHRDFAWHHLAMHDLLTVKRAQAVTLNDVVLAVVTGALRRYLERAGASTDAPPRALVPVSSHVSARDEIENRFSMMVADLPVDLDDPAEALEHIHAEMVRHKTSSQTDIGPLLFTIGGMLPPPVLRLIGPALLDRQPLVNLAVTNLPGTRDPMYLLGSHMLELYPYVTVTGNIAVIIGVLSYQDGLGVGVTVDADVVPDVDELVDDLAHSARALVDACSHYRAQPAPGPPM
jgi:diacylglycerol O-acyltransferase / wax synthase